MAHVIELLTTKTIDGDVTGFSMGKKPTGLANLTELSCLNLLEIAFLFGVFVGEKRSKIAVRAHLLSKFIDQVDCEPGLLLKLINGALCAFSNNEYRQVTCYKCQGRGCERCENTGSTRRKVQVYTICNIPKSTWYSRQYRQIRQIYENIIDYLFLMQSDIERKLIELDNHERKQNKKQ